MARRIGSFTPIWNQEMWIKPHFEMLSSLDRNVVFLHERPLPNYEKEHGYSREPDLSEYILRRYFPKVELYPSHYPEGKEFGADIFNEGTQFMQDCDIVLRLDPDMFFEPEVWKNFIDYLRNTDFDCYRMDFAKDSVNYYMTGDFDHGLKDAQELDPLAYNPKHLLESPILTVNGETTFYMFQYPHGNETTISSKDFYCHHFRGWNKPKSTPNPEWANSEYAKKALEEFGPWLSCPNDIRDKVESWQKRTGGIENTMKKDACILTVCEAGEDRSVAFATILKHDKGYTNVLNCGIKKTTPATFAMLARWADKIYVTADRTVWRLVPATFRSKAVFVDIGFDIWQSPVAPELIRICRKKIGELGL